MTSIPWHNVKVNGELLFQRQRLIGSAVAGINYGKTIPYASATSLDARQDDFEK